jgi:hypothetical protein
MKPEKIINIHIKKRFDGQFYVSIDIDAISIIFLTDKEPIIQTKKTEEVVING